MNFASPHGDYIGHPSGFCSIISLMRKTFKLRLFPSKRQEKLLRETLGECQWLYNKLLEDRKREYDASKLSLTLYDQHSQTTQYKKERQSLKRIHSQVLQ